MASLAQIQKKIEAELEKVREEALRLVCLEIEKVCDRHGWNASTASAWNVWKRGGSIHDHIEIAAADRLFGFVTWYEDALGANQFPQVMYEDGKWYPEGMTEVVHPDKKSVT